MIYVTVLRGETPLDAQPILATSDPAVVRAVTRILRRYLEAADRRKVPPAAPTSATRGLDDIDPTTEPDAA